MTLKTITVVFATTISLPAISEGFNYNYLQVGIGTSNSKFYDNEYYLSASRSVNNNFSIRGEVNLLSGDWNDPGEHETQDIDTYALDLVYNNPISTDTDLVASLGYAHLKYDKSCTNSNGSSCNSSYSTGTSPDYEHTIYKLGLRHKLSDEIELEGSYKRSNVDTGATVKQLVISGSKKINENISLGLESDIGLSSYTTNHYGVFIRRSF